MPNCETASIMPSARAGRETARAARPAKAAPSTEGPSSRPAKQLAHDGRLADPLHGLAEQPADQQQHHQLDDEHRFGGPGPPGTSAARAAAALATKTATDRKNHRAINRVGRHEAQSGPGWGNLKLRAPTTVLQDDGSCSECNCKLFATRLTGASHPKPCGARPDAGSPVQN